MSADALRVLGDLTSLARVVPAYIAFAALKHVVPLSTLARWAWRGRQVPRNISSEHRLIRTVNRLQRWLGRGDDCFQSSLLLYRELSRLGANPILTVGFRREEDRVEGHAWVSADGQTVMREDYERPFAAVMHFGPNGTLLGELERS